MPPAPRYYVRVGYDVRGPVDEATIAVWIKQGMWNAEVCVEGAGGFVPIAQTPFARHLPGAHNSGLRAGVVGSVALVVLVVLLSALRVVGREGIRKKGEANASLPTVGVQGTLASDSPLALCPAGTAYFGWPCREKKIVAQGSHVQLMKAGLHGTDAVCRYWVQGGPDDRYVGDAPCAWLKTQ